MKTVNLTDLKNRLSAYIDLVKNGESLLVLDRMIPVATVIRATSHTGSADGAAIELLERNGVLVRGDSHLRRMKISKLVVKPDKPVSVLNALLDERREGR